MRIYDDGEEFYVEDWEKWIEYQPKVGTIIEVDGSSTDQSFPPGLWLAFVVMKVQLDVDSSVILEAKFVGSEEPEINKELSLLFNRKRGFIHLCAGKPCLSDAEVSLHVTRFRVYSVEGYKKDFLTASMTRQMKKWAGMPADGPIEPEGTTASTRKPARKAREKPGKALAPAPGEDGDTGATGRLGARLQELRTRLHKARPSKTVVAEPTDPSGEVEELNSSSEENSNSALGMLETGTELADIRPETWTSRLIKAAPKKVSKGNRLKTRIKDHGSRRDEVEGGRSLLALNDGISKGMQSQLALRAAAVAKEKARGKDRTRKSSGSSVGKKLIKLLTDKTSRKGKGSSKDKRKKKKKKGHRKRVKPDPDGPGDGPTESSDSSYSTDWESERDSLSEDELEPPLRKRAKQHPGSVLKMLLSHARAQLDQSSKVALEPSSNLDIISGVKLTSYFAICVKPTLPQNMGAQRDLHHLSLAIDLPRGCGKPKVFGKTNFLFFKVDFCMVFAKNVF